jgi:hypothetical protein
VQRYIKFCRPVSPAAAPGLTASGLPPIAARQHFEVGDFALSPTRNRRCRQGQRRQKALAERDSNIQLLPKDDGGTGQGAQVAVQQAIDEGAQIVLGPLFAHSVTTAKPIARDRGIPMIAFSTDSNVAATGAYLLSFLPESDVDRVVAYAISQGKRSFIGLVPGSAYGSVVEGEFKQSVARRGGRVMALEHYADGRNKIGDAARLVVRPGGARCAVHSGWWRGRQRGDRRTGRGGRHVRQFALMGTHAGRCENLLQSAAGGGWYPGPTRRGSRLRGSLSATT